MPNNMIEAYDFEYINDAINNSCIGGDGPYTI